MVASSTREGSHFCCRSTLLVIRSRVVFKEIKPKKLSETTLPQEAGAGPFLVQPVAPQLACEVSQRWSLSKAFESRLGHLIVEVCMWAECLTPLLTNAVHSKQATGKVSD